MPRDQGKRDGALRQGARPAGNKKLCKCINPQEKNILQVSTIRIEESKTKVPPKQAGSFPWPFTPSYINEEPDMFLLLAMGYQQMWFEQREKWLKSAYPTPKPPAKLVIERASHMVPKPEPKPPFKMKKFQNIPAKVDTGLRKKPGP